MKILRKIELARALTPENEVNITHSFIEYISLDGGDLNTISKVEENVMKKDKMTSLSEKCLEMSARASCAVCDHGLVIA